MTDLAEQLAILAAKVARLEAESAILKTLHRYGHSIDYGLEADWLDCFTEEGVFDVRYPARPSAPKSARFEGRAALAQFVAGYARPPVALYKHLLIEPEIALAPDLGRADVRSYFAVLGEADRAPCLRVFGRYLDQLVAGADGVWRLSQRIAEVESVGS